MRTWIILGIAAVFAINAARHGIDTQAAMFVGLIVLAAVGLIAVMNGLSRKD